MAQQRQYITPVRLRSGQVPARIDAERPGCMGSQSNKATKPPPPLACEENSISFESSKYPAACRSRRQYLAVSHVLA
jgi:hypothetical protein